MVRFEYSDQGNTVPYPPLFDDIRRNHGFIDLRGRPDQAAEIAEGAQSPALTALLIQLASPAAALCTLGCDVGETETQQEGDRRFSAGGYIQWIFSPPTKHNTSQYDALGRALADALEPFSVQHLWSLTIIGQYVDLKLEGGSELAPSHWIWFDAYAASPEAARSSREQLLTHLAWTVANFDFAGLADRT